MASLEFRPCREDNVQIVELAGRLDTASVTEFDKKMTEIAETKVVLDLAKLEYISSAGLRSVLGALKRLGAAGGKLVLAAPARAIAEVFEISGFITLVTVYPDRTSAVAALRS